MANKIYLQEETAKTFKDSGGDVTFTLASLANGAGRISAQLDLGAAPRAERYLVMVEVKAAASLTLSVEVARLYMARGDGTDIDGPVGTSDAAIAAETRFTSNLKYVGSVIADQAAVGPFNRTFVISCQSRYLSFGIWNPSGQAFSSTGGDCFVKVTPIPDEIQ